MSDDQKLIEAVHLVADLINEGKLPEQVGAGELADFAEAIEAEELGRKVAHWLEGKRPMHSHFHLNLGRFIQGVTK